MRYSAALLVSVILSAFGFAEQPRVFITDSQSWSMSGGAGGSSSGFGGGFSGGARPQTAEIIKTFGEKCKQVTINNKPQKADYVVLLDHEGGKGWPRKDNKVAVFNSDGDTIISRSTISLGGSVDEACKAITKDWETRGKMARAATSEVKPVSAAPAVEASSQAINGKITVSSAPAGADIEIDGAFVGNTPSSIVLAPGDHVFLVKKNGYKAWERKLRVTAGEITIAADLEKSE